MGTKTCQEPKSIEDGYAAVQNLIFHQVHKFVRMYGGEFDELLGEAHELFIKGHTQFTAGVTPTGRVLKDTYATQIRRWVWYGMFDSMRLRLERNRIAPMYPMTEAVDAPAPKPSDFNVEDFMFELSEDGEEVARLVLYPPVVITTEAEGKGGTPRNYRSTVRAYLKLMGWDTDRINAAFAEIANVLG